jgi:hypothetical protein
MENPIKENRLVCDYTFAKRLLALASSLTCNDPSSEDEKESFISYANTLLKHQCLTATDGFEIEYLKRVGVYEKMVAPFMTSQDGVDIHESITRQTLYSCMKKPRVGEQCMAIVFRSKDDLANRNPDRIYFWDKLLCVEYIAKNTPTISLADLEANGLLEAYLSK